MRIKGHTFHNVSKVEIVDAAKAETAEVVVCMRVVDMPIAVFPDDVIADCAHGCGFQIRYRPYMPKAPAKICLACASDFTAAPRQ